MAKDFIGLGRLLPDLVIFAWFGAGPRGGMSYPRMILPDLAKSSVKRS
jgi:hypothetical protein